MFFIYQIKSIFKIPITATPAADPIIKTDPPVPAQYARNSQNMPSTAYIPVSVTGYIPIAPATSGTLSTIAESNPIITFIIYTPSAVWPLNVVSKYEATISNWPADCNEATASKIPKKKKIVGVSTFLKTPITESWDYTS